ncbi:MAG: hypothetical protein ACRCV0_03985 [Brevinema sp.]
MIYFLLILMTTSITFANTNNYQLSISQGQFNDKVKLAWSIVPDAQYYNIERVYDAPKKTRRGKEEKLPVDILVTNTTETQYTDSTIPFGQYKYIINAFRTNILPLSDKEIKKNKHNQTMITNIDIIASITNTGYRKVTDKEFFLEFQKGIDSSLPRIRTMKMLNFFGEKKKGWRGGQLIYKTTGIIRKPFKVMIDYKDFMDQNLTLNGLYEVQIFKLFAQEGKLVGTFHVDGIYQGTVTHNLIIKDGKSVGGTYDVQQKDGKMVSLPWDITEHPLDDSQYEKNLKGTLTESENPKK